MTLSERIVYIHKEMLQSTTQAPNLHARRLITRLESPCMSCVHFYSIPHAPSFFFFVFFGLSWAWYVRKTKRMPFSCHSPSPSPPSPFLKERPNEKIKIFILKEYKVRRCWGENAERGISRCGSAEWPTWPKKSDLHKKKNLHRPCALISHHASVIVFFIWSLSLSLCLFGPPKEYFTIILLVYYDTAWDLVKGNANREPRGGRGGASHFWGLRPMPK